MIRATYEDNGDLRLYIPAGSEDLEEIREIYTEEGFLCAWVAGMSDLLCNGWTEFTDEDTYRFGHLTDAILITDGHLSFEDGPSEDTGWASIEDYDYVYYYDAYASDPIGDILQQGYVVFKRLEG